MTFWDERFDSDEYLYGKEPNDFLRSVAGDLIPKGGLAICPGDGEGRNSVWLATQGYEVIAVDPSQVGLRKCQALARENNVHVDTVLSTAQEYSPPRLADAVVLIYLHTPPDQRTALHRHAASLLKKDGVIILEGFSPEQRLLGRKSGGPQDVDMLFTPQKLKEDFHELAIELLSEAEVELREGPGHVGLANVIRMVARRDTSNG